MTTGVRFGEAYTDPYSDIGQVDVATGWKPAPPATDPAFKWPQHVFELILGLTETTRPHGEAFEYRSIETDVLAFVMERATGKRLAQLVSEELWQKIGAEESAYFTVDSAGYALADGGFNATLRDYARFGQTILEDGAGIVPADWIAETRLRRARPELQRFHAGRQLPQPVLDRGPALARADVPGRVRATDPYRLGHQDGDGEAVDLARFHLRRLFGGDAQGRPRDCRRTRLKIITSRKIS